MRTLLFLLLFPALAHSAEDPFAAYLAVDGPVADGFDLPIGAGDPDANYTSPAGQRHEGWYVATNFGEAYSLGIHPGEDWNGRGGGETDYGQPVTTMGAGTVLEAGAFPQPWGGVVLIEHVFYEHGARRRVVSQYAHLSEVEVEPGQHIARGQRIGAIGRDPQGTFPAHLHFEVRTRDLSPTFWPSDHDWTAQQVGSAYVAPRTFIEDRRTLLVPQQEPVLLVFHQETDRMVLVEEGTITGRYEVGWGQVRGPKEREGDLKTPRGMYFVVDKARGDFPGPYGAYYGGHWIKVNYPGPRDAARGLADGLIDQAAARRIEAAWAKRALTPQDTPLGSGIGLHGWIEEWDDDATRLRSWGCMVLHNRDIAALWERIPKGAMVVVLD